MKLKTLIWIALPALLAGCNHKTSETTGDAPKRTVFFDKTGMDSYR